MRILGSILAFAALVFDVGGPAWKRSALEHQRIETAELGDWLGAHAKTSSKTKLAFDTPPY